MSRSRTVWAAALAALLAITVVALAACGGSSNTPTSNASNSPKELTGTLTVWDYYGSATPIKPAIKAFEKLHPQLTINYQAVDWDTLRQKFSVGVSSGAPPDLATLDMTWIPTYAAQGVLADLSKMSGGQLNGKPIQSQYTPGSMKAMTYDGHLVTMMYDFDAYALYYRADLFKQKGIAVPKTWTDFTAAAQKLAVTSNGKLVKYGFQVLPDTFHYAQLLYQNGGAILDPANTKAVFNSAQGVQALTFMKSFLDNGTGVYWGPDQGDSNGTAGIKDGRIAMFLNGPYMMGVLKSSAPEQTGKWAVAPAPISQKPGSYLGGTGLTIPVNAKNPEAAWAFAQFLLTPAQQLGVYKYGGAAPATVAALHSPMLTKPDPYFGGQAPFSVFLDAMATATPYPYVQAWDDIDKAISDGVTSALLGKQSPQDALNSAAQTTDSALAGQ
jgi:multiple sugar transport system substrate-binding protein